MVRVVRRAGNFADVVATGVVNGLEDCEGAGIERAQRDSSLRINRTRSCLQQRLVGVSAAVLEPGPKAEETALLPAWIWMVFSPTLQTGVVPSIGRLSTLPSTARDYVRLSGSLFSNTSHQLSMLLATRGCRERLG